jgi:hypothetical protein
LMFDCVTIVIFSFMIYICLQLCLNVYMTTVICSIIQIFNIFRDLSICLWNCFFFNGAKSEKNNKTISYRIRLWNQVKTLKIVKTYKTVRTVCT